MVEGHDGRRESAGRGGRRPRLTVDGGRQAREGGWWGNGSEGGIVVDVRVMDGGGWWW